MMYRYQRIRGLREDANLKQAILAECLPITRQRYTLHKTGAREFPLHLMLRLADFYGVTMDYIGVKT